MTTPFTGLRLATHQTDPGLASYLGRFVAEESLARAGDLPAATVWLMRLGAVVATGGAAESRLLVEAALEDGIDPVQVKEVVYHAVPYVGLGRALDVLLVVNEVLTRRGVALPLADQSTTTIENRAHRGRAVQEQIVGADAVAAMYASAPADEAHVQELLSANCFGDHYTRTGLELATRELLTFAILAALGGADPQV
jgi:4-carboxymuconolactone decarboxylase